MIGELFWEVCARDDVLSIHDFALTCALIPPLNSLYFQVHLASVMVGSSHPGMVCWQQRR